MQEHIKCSEIDIERKSTLETFTIKETVPSKAISTWQYVHNVLMILVLGICKDSQLH